MSDMILLGVILIVLSFLAWYGPYRKRQDRALLDTVHELLIMVAGFERRNGERQLNGCWHEKGEDV